MKKINSIGYAHRFLFAIIVFILLIPLIMYVVYELFSLSIVIIPIIASLLIGLALLIIFIVLLTIEFHQDKLLDKYYSCNVQTKIILSNGKCECQKCGNRQVNSKDRHCAVCGIEFKSSKGVKPYQK